MKKLFATFLALVMMLSLVSVSAFAATPAPTKDGHTYTAYQIFSGTQDKDATELGNIVWGTGINAEGFLAALKADAALGATFADCKTAADVAEAMSGDSWADKSDNAKAFAKLAENFVKGDGVSVVNGQTELDAGYYLVVDTTAEVGSDDANNVALLQLTQKGIFEIAKKNEVPEVVKKIVEGENRVDSNNASIGDKVPYEITTAVPVSAPDYEYYFFIIRDTMSKGLTFNNDIKVTIGGETAELNKDYSVKYNADGYTFQIALADAEAHAGQSVVVTYSATLNSDAVYSNPGNPNGVNIKYSNNPNEDYGTKPTGKDYPGFPAEEKFDPKGETPTDYTITYTTQIKLFKIDQDEQPLSGAEFTLSGETVNKVLVYEEVFTAVDANGKYYKLKDGTYTKDAPTVNSVKPAAEGATAGYVKDNTATGDDVVTIGSDTYRPYVPAKDKDAQIFVLVKGNADQYVSTTQMYTKETKLTEKTAAGEAKKVAVMVDEDGVAYFRGLSEGTYTLTETKTPAGYNTIDPIEFTINWAAPEEGVTAGNEKCTWSVATDEKSVKSGVKYVEDDQAFELTIVNQKGTTLPETGGIGTTIFYVVGSLLLVGAAVTLVAKKRMESEK